MRRLILSAALLTATAAASSSSAMADEKPAAPAPAAAAATTTKPAARPAAAPPPTETEVREAFDAGDYGKTLQLLQRVVNLKGTAAAAYDRHDMLMLKGESHLRLKQYKSAADAFAAAAKATEDEVQQATARATQRLVLEAKGPTIQRRNLSRGAKPETADLLDPAQREQALRIAHADLLAAAEPKVKEARRAQSLPPIVAAMELVAATRDFELAGVPVDSGGESAAAMRDELAGRAKELIEKELAHLEADVVEIHERADIVATQRYTQGRSMRRSGLSDPRVPAQLRGNDLNRDEPAYETTTVTEYRRGLYPEDKRDLNNVIASCRKIVPAVESLARNAGTPQAEADALVRRANDISRAAKRVLNTKY